MSIKPITLILTNLSIKNDKNNQAKPDLEPKKRGRPKKIIIEDNDKPIEPKKRGRPKKNTTNVLNREELMQLKEPKKRGRPKKNITIADDTSSESSVELLDTNKINNKNKSNEPNEPKRRGRPRNKIETYDSEDSEDSEDSISDSEQEEGFYIKLDKNATYGYTFIESDASINEAEYLITDKFKLYTPDTFTYCGTWNPKLRAPCCFTKPHQRTGL